MPKYLLTASEKDMKRWKARAEDLGMSFANYLRAGAYLLEEQEVDQKISKERSPHVGGKRTYRPDPK